MAKADPTPVQVGQVWRRYSDRMLVTVLSVDGVYVHPRRLIYQGFRRSQKLVSDFRREYFFVRQGRAS